MVRPRRAGTLDARASRTDVLGAGLYTVDAQDGAMGIGDDGKAAPREVHRAGQDPTAQLGHLLSGAIGVLHLEKRQPVRRHLLREIRLHHRHGAANTLAVDLPFGVFGLSWSQGVALYSPSKDLLIEALGRGDVACAQLGPGESVRLPDEAQTLMRSGLPHAKGGPRRITEEPDAAGVHDVIRPHQHGPAGRTDFLSCLIDVV